MRINKIFDLLLALILIWGLVQFAPTEVRAGDATDGPRAVLIQLAELSKKEALQTEAARSLFTGEMRDLKVSSFGKLTDTPDKVVLLDKNSAVGRFQLFGANDHITDVYFYLQNDGGWRINAVRLLALTGILEQAYLGLKAKTNLTEEEKDSMENLRLTLAPDKELKTWFSAHSKSLEKLGSLLHGQKKQTAVYVRRDDQSFPAAAELLRALHLRGASVAGGNVELVIGGVTDNTVGFIYSPSHNPPGISSSSYIWVEEVAPNWYLFRTT